MFTFFLTVIANFQNCTEISKKRWKQEVTKVWIMGFSCIGEIMNLKTKMEHFRWPYYVSEMEQKQCGTGKLYFKSSFCSCLFSFCSFLFLFCSFLFSFCSFLFLWNVCTSSYYHRQLVLNLLAWSLPLRWEFLQGSKFVWVAMASQALLAKMDLYVGLRYNYTATLLWSNYFVWTATPG